MYQSYTNNGEKMVAKRYKTNGGDIVRTEYRMDWFTNTCGPVVITSKREGPMYENLRSIKKYQKNTNGGKKK